MALALNTDLIDLFHSHPLPVNSSKLRGLMTLSHYNVIHMRIEINEFYNWLFLPLHHWILSVIYIYFILFNLLLNSATTTKQWQLPMTKQNQLLNFITLKLYWLQWHFLFLLVTKWYCFFKQNYILPIKLLLLVLLFSYLLLVPCCNTFNEMTQQSFIKW